MSEEPRKPGTAQADGAAEQSAEIKDLDQASVAERDASSVKGGAALKGVESASPTYTSTTPL